MNPGLADQIALKGVFIVFIVLDVNSMDLTIIVFWIYGIIPPDRNWITTYALLLSEALCSQGHWVNDEIIASPESMFSLRKISLIIAITGHLFFFFFTNETSNGFLVKNN